MAVAMVAGSIGCFSCFSTARYDDAHIQRVANINARYEAARRHEDEQYALLVTSLDQFRRYLLPVKLDSQPPPRRGDDRGNLIALRDQCLRDVCQPGYVDMLIKTYAGADAPGRTSQLSSSQGELASQIAVLHNQEVLRTIDERTRRLEQQRAQVHRRLEAQRRDHIQASEQQRSSEIASGRALRRARLQAAAHASTTMGQGPIRGKQICVDAGRRPPSATAGPDQKR